MRLLPLVLLPAALFAAAEPAPPLPDEGEGYEHIERFIHVLETVRRNHPDADRLGYERLVNQALEGMLGSLDKFSAFYHPETYAYISETKKQPELPGLGITLGKSADILTITAVRDRSPATRAGIAAGDRLLRIGDTDIAALPLSIVLLKLSGRPGASVTLRLQRHTDREDYDATLLRTLVKRPAVPEAFLLPGANQKKIGYIRLSEFSAPSHRELEAALDDLEEQGMEHLILDLRGNPGGLLNAAVAILGEFLPPATEVVETRGRNPEHRAPAMQTPDRKRRKRTYPMAVLIDRGSASASELVAGALQDLDRASVVGELSYGKGSVQNVVPLGAGTALRLTTATYHTPSGRTPHEVGVTPDVTVEISETDRKRFDLWCRRTSASPEERTLLRAWTDPVLAAAIGSFGSKASNPPAP